MSKLVWDKLEERIFETGCDQGVLFPMGEGGVYGKGVVWNGLTNVNDSPSGAEPSPKYADNIKYLNMMSAEEFAATIEAYTYPPEFEVCDGSAEPVPGMSVGQQTRKQFGFSYRTLVGNGVEGQDYGYKLHLVYGALASPSEKSHPTINDSPEAVLFSWEITTTPIEIPGFKPSASITLDSTKLTAAQMKAVEEVLYGKDGEPAKESRLPLPEELITLLTPPSG